MSKLTLKSGAMAAGESLGQWLKERGVDQKNAYVVKQVKLLTEELGVLKGSLMKAGQLLSTYGEHFLPPEAIEFLKTLQSQSPSVEWGHMKQHLAKELSQDLLAELEIDPEPLAAASLGQVHRAKIKNTDETIVLKIQYPNLQRVVDSDIKALRRLLRVMNFLPKNGNYDNVFVEVKNMLTQELDYKKEADHLDMIGQILQKDSRFVVPKVYRSYSTQRVLAMSFEQGLSIDDPQVKKWPLERRNNIGRSFLELYFMELFDFGFMQTDPHLGNYRVRPKEKKGDQLVLFNYGAVRQVPLKFLNDYYKIVLGSYDHNVDLILEGALDLKMIEKGDPKKLVDRYLELCLLITEPFTPHDKDLPPLELSPPLPEGLIDERGNYDWGKSDLPKRVVAVGKDIILSFRLRTPPCELIFLDRKLGGTFSFLSVLKCNLNGRALLDKWIYDPPRFRQ